MRIEQRIGRVHRLTQDRTVYVANLYAVDTLDERILDILRNKLRVFELFFGQLTTVLGSLRDTLENLVMGGVVEADSDADQDRRLEELGVEIGETRDSTESELSEQGHLAWLGGGSPGSGSRQEEASELLAEEAGPQGRSEQQAEEFVQNYLTLVGCEIVYEDDRFVTVSLNTELAERFDVPELHLAFSPSALEMHPDAELCVVGSELFEEFMDAIAETGDLLCEVPEGYEDLLGLEGVVADTGIEFVNRTVLGPKFGAFEATWRVTDDAAIGGDEIVTASMTGAEGRSAHTEMRALAGGESFPASFPSAEELVEQVKSHSIEQIRSYGEGVQEEANERTASELAKRIQQRLRDLWRRRRNTDRENVDRAYSEQIDELNQRLEREQANAPEVRVMADLLAVRLTGRPVIELRETWADASGPFEIETELDLGTGVQLRYSTDGHEITHLTVCATRHPVDRDRTKVCLCCSELVCELCTDRFQFGECDLCGVSVCGECLPPSETANAKSLCRACRSPERCEELDDSYRLGFQLGGSSTLLVGLREAEFDKNDGSAPVTIVPNEDVDDPLRVKLRTYAVAKGLGASVSAKALELQMPDVRSGEIGEARSITDLENTVRLEDGLPLHLDGDAVAGLSIDGLPECDVLSEQGSGLSEVLEQCRTYEVPLPATLVVSRVAQLRTLTLTAEGLESITTKIQANAEPEVLSEQRYAFETPSPDDELGLVLASATADDLTVKVRRVNHSYLLEVPGRPVAFVAGHPDADCETEIGWAALLASHGISDGRVWFADLQPPRLEGRLAEPTKPVCNDRDVTAGFVLTEGSGELPAGRPSNYGMDNWNGEINFASADTHVASIVAQIGRSAAPVQEISIVPALTVTEQWSDVGNANFTYLVADYEPLNFEQTQARWVAPESTLAPTDEHGETLDDFEIDYFGAVRPCLEDLFDCSALPSQLHARGLKGHRSSDGVVDVVYMKGRIRQEVVRLRHGSDEVLSWETLSDRPIKEQQLALSVIGHLGLDVSEVEVEVDAGTQRAAELPGDAHLLMEETHYILSAALDSAGGDELAVGNRHTSINPLGDDALVVAHAARHLGLPSSDGPTAGAVTSHHERIFARIPDGSAPLPVLMLRYTTSEIRAWVDDVGLHIAESDSEGSSAQTCRWETADTPRWAVDDWNNPPSIVLLAELDGTSVALARKADFFLLASRTRAGREQFRLSGDPTQDFVRSAIGAELIAADAVAEVTEIADRSNCARPVVKGGRDPNEISCRPIAVESTSSDPVELSVDFVQEAFDGRHVFPTIDFGEALTPLWNPKGVGSSRARGLVNIATEQLPDTTERIGIGWEITDSWQVDDKDVEVTYKITPGQTQGFIECHVTGERLEEATVDRSGHAIAAYEVCPYCETRTCSRCEQAAEPCGICHFLICGNCAQEPRTDQELHVCNACSSLQKAGWYFRWSNRSRLDNRGVSYSGSDTLHEVVVQNVDGHWTVSPGDTEPMPLSPEAVDLLSTRLTKRSVR